MSDAAPARFVVDASVAVKWFRSGERYIDQATALLDAQLAGAAQLLLSELIPFEVGNALQVASDAEVQPLDPLWSSGFVWISLEPGSAAATRVIAVRHRLSFYDASYLALALQEQAYLVTDDQLLLAAGEAEGVGVALEQIPVPRPH